MPFNYPYYNPTQTAPVMTPSFSSARNNIVWVQGKEGAKAMQVPPNGVALFMDSENEGTFYIKTTDNIGISTMRTFHYEEVIEKTPVLASPDEYVTRKELEEIIASLKGGTVNEQPVPAVE